MKNYETIDVERAGEVMTVSLDRPRLNLFNGQMMEELIHVWHSLRREPSIRFVILTAKGDHFSAGADLGEIGINDFKPEDARIEQFRREYH